ncbi:DNA translocase FtsK 4TM domain-containing protein [Candidatus Dependentiae bacterium]|nr:DNA translocase FtsK 4TM domain-containing protein [Candidatus Dependentiae bacterium]
MKEKYIAYLHYYVSASIVPVLMIVCSIVTMISMMSFRANDLSILYYATQGTCQNSLGYFGSSFAAILVYLFGSMAYVVPFLFAYGFIFAAKLQNFYDELDRCIGALLTFFILSVLCAYYKIGLSYFCGYGGLVGIYGLKLLKSFDPTAQIIILYALLFAASILLLRFVHLRFTAWIFVGIKKIIHYSVQIDNMPAKIVRGFAWFIFALCMSIWSFFQWSYRLLKGTMIQDSSSSTVQFEREDEPIDLEVDQILKMLQEQNSSIKTKHDDFENIMQKEAIIIADQKKLFEKHQQQEEQIKKQYFLPDIEKMLSKGPQQKITHVAEKEFVEQAAILEEKLQLFGIKGKVVRIHPGPVITLFEYKPDNTVKLSKILGLEDDLAMALQALSIRIIAPIPGKDVVGFEVSNKIRTPVLLADIFHSTSWTKFKGSLPLILGEDTAGNHFVVDLASMPHLLIAGSTGSGKSVALNCMLVSLLCAKKPEHLKLIIIDPKQIEFTAYEKIAHLLFPVVNDPKKALPILKWLVMTMEERYDLMAKVGAKNIFEYHKLEATRSDLEHMPFIVLMIDELADLMMTTGKDIETMIARLAQMSRAAGIHMIVATQRPSVDVITGLIKVNFPNRISFKVTSKVDSRTILDEVGAERLLGKGDMLFIDAKDPHMRRIHGAYVSDNEIEYLVSHVESQQTPNFLDISDFFTQEQSDDALYETDQELYQQVVDMLKDCDEVSISMIQRKFRIGFNRSARIMQTLESRGLIMSSDGGKMRRVVKE